MQFNADEPVRGFGQVAQKATACDHALTGLSKSVGGMMKGFNQLKGAVTGLLGALGIDATLNGLKNNIMDVDKQTFALSRTAKVTGQSMKGFQDTIDKLGGKTLYTRTQLAQIMNTFASSRQGVQASTAQMMKFAEAADKAFGTSSEEGMHAISVIVNLKQAVPGIYEEFEKLKDQQSVHELGQKVKALSGASDETINSVQALAQEFLDMKNNATGTGTEINNLATLQRALYKSADDFVKQLGPELKSLFTYIDTQIVQVVKSMGLWLKQHPQAVKWIAIFTGIGAAITVLGPLIAGLGGLVSGVGSIMAATGVAVNIAWAPVLLTVGAVAAALGGIAYALGWLDGPIDAVKDLFSGKMFNNKEIKVPVEPELDESALPAMEAELTQKMADLSRRKASGSGTASEQKELQELETSITSLAAKVGRLKDAKNAALEGGSLIGGRDELSFVTGMINEVGKLAKENEALVNAKAAQAEYSREYEGDTEKAVENQKAVIQSYDALIAKQREVASQTGLNEMQRQQEQKKLLEFQKAQREAMRGIGQQYEANYSKLEAEANLAESQYNLAKSMYLGLSQQIQMQTQMVSLYEEQATYAQQTAKAILEQYGNDMNKLRADKDAYAQYMNWQQKSVNLEQKKLELTKNLREGYLNAIASFNNVEGSFAKIITKKEQGMGTNIRNFMASSSAGAGGKGGLNSAYAKFDSGSGQLHVAGEGDINKLYESRGLGDIFNRKARATPMSAMAGMSPGQQGAIMAGGANDPAATSVQKLDNNMSKHVEIGVANALKRSGGSIEIAKEFAKQTIGETDTRSGQPGGSSNVEYDAKIATLQSKIAEIQKGVDSDRMGSFHSDVGIGKHGASARGGRKLTAEDAYRLNRQERSNGIDTTGWRQASQDRRKKFEEDWIKDQQSKGGQVLRERGQTRVLQKGKGEYDYRVINPADLVKTANGIIAKKEYRSSVTGAMGEMSNRANELSKIAKNTENISKTADKQLQQGKDMIPKAGSTDSLRTSASLGAGGKMNAGRGESAGWDDLVSSILGFAGGGVVPGVGSGDTQPAMLTPGEFVVKKDVARRILPFLQSANKHHYATGGIVGMAPTDARMGGMAGGSPQISIAVKGDSVNRILKSVNQQLAGQLNKMMVPYGTTGRRFEESH
jgi:hypothetical protein